jgi:hypothetical protein
MDPVTTCDNSAEQTNLGRSDLIICRVVFGTQELGGDWCRMEGTKDKLGVLSVWPVLPTPPKPITQGARPHPFAQNHSIGWCAATEVGGRRRSSCRCGEVLDQDGP